MSSFRLPLSLGIHQNTSMPILKLLLVFAITIAVSGTCLAATLTRIEESTFGQLKDGTPVKIFTLRNEHGMVAKVMEHGAIISELQVLDRQGRATNVLLGAKTLNEYLTGFAGSAAVIGRFANRIGYSVIFKNEEGNKVEEGGPNHRLERGKDLCRHHRRY